MSLTMEERVTRYETMRREGRLLRRVWVATHADRRELACWLAALSPEVGAAKDPWACPADVMPRWLAILTPGLDDMISDDAWPALAGRFGRCAARWHALGSDAWARVERAVKLEALSIAREAVTVDKWGVLPAIDEVMRLLREGGSQQEWAAARAAADTADAADVAYIATDASDAAADAAANAAARAAARAAAYAAGAARAAAWDRIAAALFNAIDREVNPPATLAQE